MSVELYNYLTHYGDFYRTKHELKQPAKFVRWTEENFEYIKYNPRKPVERYGLSITSLDGGLSGVPDLDSLIDYANDTGLYYKEQDFREKTPVYFNQDLQRLLSPISDYIFRSHVLRMDPGGFFPPHRDYYSTHFDSFRAVIPLENMNPPEANFVIEDKFLHWHYGSLYFVDTCKMHLVFNASFKPMYMIVLNIDLNEDTVKFMTENLYYQ